MNWRNKKNHDEIALLPKTNLDWIKDLSRSLMEGAQLGSQRFVLGNQGFPVQVWLPAMCKGLCSNRAANV